MLEGAHSEPELWTGPGITWASFKQEITEKGEYQQDECEKIKQSIFSLFITPRRYIILCFIKILSSCNDRNVTQMTEDSFIIHTIENCKDKTKFRYVWIQMLKHQEPVHL